MEKRSKAVIILILGCALVAAVASYYRYMVMRDINFVTEGFSLEEEEAVEE